MKKTILTLIIVNLTLPKANAEIIKIPDKSGFSGFVMGGASLVDYSSNLFEGSSNSNEEHNGLFNEPKSQQTNSPILGLDIRYTFSDTKTQIFLGNLIQDAIQFDFTQQLGIRQEFSNKGVVALSYVFPILPTKTWSNPYASGPRNDTTIDSSGMRLNWDDIWGSNLNANITFRKYVVDDEFSGLSSGLTNDDVKLLNRNGKSTALSISYDWIISRKDIVTPQLNYTNNDLDGKAMSNDRFSFKLSYIHMKKEWTFSGNLYAAHSKYEKTNPIFNERDDTEELGINASLFFNNIFSVEKLSFMISSSYAISRSKIDFFKQDFSTFSTGVVYSF